MLYLAKQGPPEMMFVTHFLSISIDFTDVTLVSEDTYYRLYWCDSGEWWYIWPWLPWWMTLMTHTSKKRKSLRSPKYFAGKVRKSRQQNFATKVRKSWNEAKIYKKVGLLTTRTCSLDIYGVSSQHFDTSLKLLLFLTKFNRANLVVFAFSNYNFAENQNNLRSPDFQDFLDVWSEDT